MPGTSAWADLEQLLLVLDAAGGARLVRADDDEVVVRTSNRWWAEQMTGELGAAQRRVSIAGRTVRLVLEEAPPPNIPQRVIGELRRRAVR